MAFINDDDTESLIFISLIFKKKWLLPIIDKMHEMKPMHYSAIRMRVPGITDSGFNSGMNDLTEYKFIISSNEDPFTNILSYVLSPSGILLRPLILEIKKLGLVSW